MIHPVSITEVIPAGATKQISLKEDERFTKTTVAVRVGTAGVLSFRVRALFGQYETPGEPNTIDMADRKSIYFDGIALDGIEIANGGAQDVTVAIGQTAA